MGNRLSSKNKLNYSAIAEHVIIHLYTNDKPDEPFLLNLWNCEESSLNGTNLTVVLTHGFHDTGNNIWIRKSRINYLERLSCNVIILDWSYFAQMDYVRTTKFAPQIAHYMAQILLELVKIKELNVKKLQLVGHSLGAHLCGFIGKCIFQHLNVKIGRITGLDPSGPLYGIPVLVNSKKRLSRTDADFVDIIHTCRGVFGISQQIGDVDFYPNGGSLQPGCGCLDINCKHFRAALYYTESVSCETAFISHKCNSWGNYVKGKCENGETELMGFPVNTTARGKYYLRTNCESPFAQRHSS